MKTRYTLYSLLLSLLVLAGGCIREEEFDNTPQGNFEALWQIINEQYCFLDYKQIDWDAIHDKYQPLITSDMSNDGLFEVLGNMLAELKDGHVNLYSASNTARYWDWYLDYPRNFDEAIVEQYLGRDYRISGGLKYRILTTTSATSTTATSRRAWATAIWTKPCRTSPSATASSSTCETTEEAILPMPAALQPDLPTNGC